MWRNVILIQVLEVSAEKGDKKRKGMGREGGVWGWSMLAGRGRYSGETDSEGVNIYSPLRLTRCLSQVCGGCWGSHVKFSVLRLASVNISGGENA